MVFANYNRDNTLLMDTLGKRKKGEEKGSRGGEVKEEIKKT